MSRRIAMVIVPLLAVAIYFSGCVGEIGDVPEAQTPTGCHKSEGRYYDPQVGKCVHPSSPHEARILNEYRYVNKLAEEGKVEEAEYAISFDYIPISKAEELWTFLREKGVTLEFIVASLPTEVKEDSEYKEIVENGAKVWGAAGISHSCGWDRRSSAVPQDQTITNFVEASVQTKEEKVHKGPWPELRKAIFEDGDCRIAELYVTANPRTIRDFWNAYLDDVMAIQPRITSVDTVQAIIVPTQHHIEGE